MGLARRGDPVNCVYMSAGCLQYWSSEGSKLTAAFLGDALRGDIPSLLGTAGGESWVPLGPDVVNAKGWERGCSCIVGILVGGTAHQPPATSTFLILPPLDIPRRVIRTRVIWAKHAVGDTSLLDALYPG